MAVPRLQVAAHSHTGTWVDALCLTTVQEGKQRFQTAQMAMVTALQGFIRRPVLHAQTAGGTPTTHLFTSMKSTAARQGKGDSKNTRTPDYEQTNRRPHIPPQPCNHPARQPTLPPMRATRCRYRRPHHPLRTRRNTRTRQPPTSPPPLQ